MVVVPEYVPNLDVHGRQITPGVLVLLVQAVQVTIVSHVKLYLTKRKLTVVLHSNVSLAVEVETEHVTKHVTKNAA